MARDLLRPMPSGERRARLAYLAALAIVLPLGFAAKAYDGPGRAWVGGHGAGVLYVVFWVFAALAVRPAWSPGRVAAAVLALTCALELAQLEHPPWLEAARATWLGDALLGSTFDPVDLPHYALGALLAWCVGRAVRARAATA